MPNDGSPDPARRSKRAHTAILAATRELIMAVGYDAMTIEAIASAAGVGKQTIYRWWPSKAAVVLDMWVPDVEQQLVFPDTGDVAADFTTQIRAMMELSQDPLFGPSLRALIAEAQHDQALAQKLLDRIFAPRAEQGKERLRAAQQARQVRDDVDLDIAMDLLYGGFYRRFLLRIAPVTADYPKAVVDAALAGLMRRRTRR
ncbi:MAG TPA: TetR/AcrR family transcriptional regulator [Streptosporangiaceae bacterium]|jgi:AcrR family transcriptional regulator|nr:TetR/AcrR family transcriptional regulator [Streptosporangiaceae bacterium]